MKIEKYFDKEKMKSCTIYTMIFMLLAYMYAYTNGNFLFDAAIIYRGEEPFVVGSDKWFLSFLGILDAHINIPWLAGLLSIFFMSLAVYCIVDIFQIKSRMAIILTTGLCCTQSSIICQQEYIGGNYTGEIALLFACLAVWSVVRIEKKWIKTVISIVCIAISAGTYGAYIGMVPCLMLIILVMNIMQGNAAKDNWRAAVEYALLFLVGMITYYVILRCAVSMTGSQLQAYMGEDNISSVSGVLGTVFFIPGAYRWIFWYYTGKLNYLPSSLNKLMVVILVLGILLLIVLFIKYSKKIRDRIANILLLLIIVVIFPLAINLIYVLASGSVHFLMIFPYVIPFLIIVKLIDICIEKKIGVEYRLTIAIVISLSVFLYYSVVMANAVMVHLNHMFVETQSICTTMLSRIEDCEGFNGTEDVVFIGALQYNDYFQVTKETEAEILNAFLGPGNSNNVNGVNWGSWLRRYMSNILNSSLDYSHYDSLDKFIENNENIEDFVIEEIIQMSDYPFKGSVKKINEVIYVYLGEEDNE